ncbi:carbohydrate ABC transporter permease [Allonocardiopsis opalescens]|uniref:Carbohydrate ABC transporter membrane protein 1 (CUT1 family) n=1 Tax=Allonocardiopsis opalescens TaxID=1144618 RepID=A0A2T0PYI0_9ACTN|nr:sugar ABC transporter permease [Allonocardiopsis opalescens]PRX96562.1 carbohydrate ABC transporter membrane protein 1 (CUT1 family) [Allonocardiopsis opalescens]
MPPTASPALFPAPPETARSRPSPRPGAGRRAREARTGIVLSLPLAAVVAVLFVVPVGLAGWMSLHDWPLLGAPAFSGGRNYALAVQDRLFVEAVVFTLKYTAVTTVVLLTLSLGLALLVQRPGRGVGLARTAFFQPAVVGLAVASLLWYVIFSDEAGPLGPLLAALGIGDGTVDWFGTPGAALWSTVLMITWRFAGFYMLVLLTGLQAIPDDVYEAARVDGAGWWRTLRHVTLPLLRPTLALALTLCVTGSLLAFEQFVLLTSGGPDNSTVTVVMTVYRQAFTLLDVGVAAAMSVLVALVLVVGNVVQLSILRERGDRR